MKFYRQTQIATLLVDLPQFLHARLDDNVFIVLGGGAWPNGGAIN